MKRLFSLLAAAGLSFAPLSVEAQSLRRLCWISLKGGTQTAPCMVNWQDSSDYDGYVEQ